MSTKYEVWMTSDAGSVKVDYVFNFLKYAEEYLDTASKSDIAGYTSAFVVEISPGSPTLAPKIVATRNYRNNGHFLDNFKYLTSCPPYNTLQKIPAKDTNVTTYTVVITDLNDKFLGLKSDTKIGYDDGITMNRIPSSIGKAFYYKEGKLEARVRYVDKCNSTDWIKELIKDDPTTPVAPTPPVEEWTNWSMTPPPHLHIVIARRYGGGEVEVDTKYLSSTFDPHGMEWKVRQRTK